MEGFLTKISSKLNIFSINHSIKRYFILDFENGKLIIKTDKFSFKPEEIKNILFRDIYSVDFTESD